MPLVPMRLILDHGTEAYKVAELLAEKKIPVIVGPVRTSPERPETEGATLENAALLHRAGVTIAFQTNEVHNVRNLPFEAAFAVAYGLPEDTALRSLTLTPAELFGLERAPRKPRSGQGRRRRRLGRPSAARSEQADARVHRRGGGVGGEVSIVARG